MHIPSHHPHWGVCSTHAIFETDAVPIWKLIADFNGLPKILPGAVSSSTDGSGVGMVRIVKLEDGRELHEQLIVLHPELFRLSYAMRDPAPFPWKHYFATQQLQPLGAGQTHFLATGFYHLNGAPDSEVKEILRGAYHGIFENIGRLLGVDVAIQG